MPIDALSVVRAQLTRDLLRLLAIAKFLLTMSPTIEYTAENSTKLLVELS